jgi:cytochrome bd-type quinol oxidase subunit 2
MLNAITSAQAKTPDHFSLGKHHLPHKNRWTVRRLLFCGGTMLVILGITGVTGLLGLLSRANLFNPPNWIHWIHLCFGLFVLTVAMIGYQKLQMGLALLGAVAGTALGLAGLASALYARVHNSAQSLDISDPVAHLAVGALAIWALRNTASRPSR